MRPAPAATPLEGRAGGLRAAPPVVRFAALALAALGVATVITRAVAIRSDDLAADDFTQDFVSARAWTNDEDPYGFQRPQLARLADADIAADSLRPGHRNPHTPTQILATAPFTRLPYRDARTLWLVFTAGCMAFAGFLLARSYRWSSSDAAVAGLAVIAIPVVGSDLLYGQLGGPLLLLLVVAWREQAAGHERRAGFALGAACALKLFPLFLLIPLIRKRRARMVLMTIATAGVLGTASMLLVGTAPTGAWMTEVAPDNFSFWRAAPVNIALPGLPFRWLTDSPWRADGPDLVSLATMIAIGVMILCEVAALTTRSAMGRDLFLSALPWMLLAGPLTGDLSLPLVLPFAVIVARAAFRQQGLRRLLLLAALTILAIGIPPGVSPPRPGLSVAVIFLGYGLPTIALLGLALADRSARLEHPADDRRRVPR